MDNNRRYDRVPEKRERTGYERLALGLGWFSVGLGLAEVAAPGFIAKLIGISDDSRNTRLLRSPLYGMRELAAGAGILAQSEPTPWVWSRVAGDLMDLGSLGKALTSENNERNRVLFGIAAVLGVTVLDVMCAKGLTNEKTEREGGQPQTTKATTINKSPEEVYAFWHDFENLPRFMTHLESVRSLGSGRSHWTASGPFGKKVEWDAQISEDIPNRRIGWSSVANADVHNEGTVEFEPGPGGRGTVLKVNLSYDPPGGMVGAAVAKLFGKDADQMLSDDLRAFKQIMEIGEIMRSDASIHSKMHAAQPPVENEKTLVEEFA